MPNVNDPMLYIASGNGNFAGSSLTAVNKFGRSTNVDAEASDIHDGNNATDDVNPWVAPTVAQTHTVRSDNAADTPFVETLTAAANAANTETVTIGDKTYTFQDTLTNVDGNVHVGASASDSLDNLIAAINLSGGTPGTDYAAAMTSPDTAVIAAKAGAGDTMLLYATSGIATTETGANLSWGNATAQAGGGAKTLRLYGLTSWTSDEVSEDITLTGVDNVTTTNSYVIIHRMKVLTKGATNVNVGKITATGTVDTSTVTAQINAGQGQTQMAIYGLPSTKTAYMTQYYASGNSATAASATFNVSLLVNPEPDAELTKFLTKHTQGLFTDGTNYMRHEFNPYFKIDGPAIIKISALGGAANQDVSAGFDLILV